MAGNTVCVYRVYCAVVLRIWPLYWPVVWPVKPLSPECHFFVGKYIRKSIDSVPPNGEAVDTNYFYAMSTPEF